MVTKCLFMTGFSILITLIFTVNPGPHGAGQNEASRGSEDLMQESVVI
jgi:hypothetical protein